MLYKDITGKKISGLLFEIYIYGFVYQIAAKNISEAKMKAFKAYKKENEIFL